MAVARMKKAVVIGWQEQAEAVLAFLQTQGLLHVEKIPLNLITDLSLTAVENQQKVTELQALISKAQYCLSFLDSFTSKPTGLLSNFIKPRVVTSVSEYDKIFNPSKLEALYRECEALEDNLSDLNNYLKAVRDKKEFLEPWQSLDVPAADIKATNDFGLTSGFVEEKLLSQVQADLTAKKIPFDLTVVSKNQRNVYFVLLWPQVKTKQVQAVLAAANFTAVDLTSYKDKPAAELKVLAEQELKTKNLILEYTKKGQELALAYPSLKIILDYLNNELAKSKALGLLATTAESYVFSGWVEADKQEELASQLDKVEGVAEYFFTDPEPGEKPPVILKNHWLIRPFEAVTKMYGLPDYAEQDPTPIMAPFFFLFFGLALGDAGYGLVLLLLTQFLKRRLTLTESGRAWLDLFSYGGVAAIIVGILTGGYFGFEAAKLPAILRKAIIIDPLNQAVILLLFSWALGVVQVASGLLIEFFDSLKLKQWEEAFYDHLPQLLLLLSAAVVAGVWLGEQIFKTKAFILTQVSHWGGVAALIAVVYFILAKGRLLSFFWLSFKKIKVAALKESLKEKLQIVVDNLFFLVSILLIALSFFKLISLTSVFIFLGLALIISKAVRGALLRLAQSLYELYGMTSYLGDILSYSRLMALGLVSVLIGFVINVMVGLIIGVKVGGLPIGIILGIGLAIPLHVLNLLISLLGAFVHPLRLQYVEFFSKFYSNGGKAFKPLKIEAENIYFASGKK